MSIPYRTQQAFKRLGIGILILVLLMTAGISCWFVWAQRYIIYTADGEARLDFDLPPIVSGALATPPEQQDVTIRFDTPKPVVSATTELKQMLGYYVEPAALEDLSQVKAQIQALPAGTPVMIDVKNIHGAFYYSSQVSATRSGRVDIQQMDSLLSWLSQRDVYLIAKLPALRDYAYGLNHVPDGVHHISGGYLYQDNEGCYWLNPSSQGTVTYLSKIIVELRNLGFDEVVLEDFCFPSDEESILINGDRQKKLTDAAEVLVTACTTETFAVSFVKTEDFVHPQGRSRIYLSGVDAADAAAAAEQSGVGDTKVNLVFLTELHDTRFENYGVLRPLSGAH